MVDTRADNALRQHQTHHFGAQAAAKQKGSPLKGQQAGRGASQLQQEKGPRGRPQNKKLVTHLQRPATRRWGNITLAPSMFHPSE